MPQPTLQIVIASTRPGRVGLPVGQWFYERAAEHGGFDVELVDLAEINLPFLDEPKHPRLGDYAHQHTRDWSAKVYAADAFVFVTPEYNHGYTAPLKNAIDFLWAEWQHKPVGFVSYGGVAAGTRSVQQLKQVVAVLKMVPTVANIAIPSSGGLLDDQGRVQGTDHMAHGATALLAELQELEATLRPLRRRANRAG